MNRKFSLLILAGAGAATCLLLVAFSYGTNEVFQWVHSLSELQKASLRIGLLLLAGVAVVVGVVVRRKSGGPSEF
jgi:hypothetical protein